MTPRPPPDHTHSVALSPSRSHRPDPAAALSPVEQTSFKAAVTRLVAANFEQVVTVSRAAMVSSSAEVPAIIVLVVKLTAQVATWVVGLPCL